MKKWLFKSQDFIAFFFGVFSGFWINLVTGKWEDLSIFYGVIATIIGIIGFFCYKSWINTQDEFDFFIQHSTWEKKNFDDVETWTCKDTDEYQLVLWDIEMNNFHQKWTEIFPDNEHNKKYKLFLKRNGIIVREFRWVSCDGWRVFMPIPKSNKWEPYLKRDSLEFRMLEKIGYSQEIDFAQIFEEGNIQII